MRGFILCQEVPIMASMYEAVGLTLKVKKHLDLGNLDKAAMYFAARAVRDGKPEEGSAEYAELQQLKAAGYKFYRNGDDVVAVKPNGRIYSGEDVLQEWTRLCST
jgi:hypothetical protein